MYSATSGLNLLDLIHELVDNDDELLQVQSERFLDSMNEDDQAGEDVDFAESHLGAFNAVFSKVLTTDCKNYLTVVFTLTEVSFTGNAV